MAETISLHSIFLLLSKVLSKCQQIFSAIHDSLRCLAKFTSTETTVSKKIGIFIKLIVYVLKCILVFFFEVMIPFTF